MAIDRIEAERGSIILPDAGQPFDGAGDEFDLTLRETMALLEGGTDGDAGEDARSPADDIPIRPGLRIAKSFVVSDSTPLGAGGMSRVYPGRAIGSAKERVAIKVLSADKGLARAYASFEQELAAHEQCQHPQVARLIAWDVLLDERPVLVFEYVDGMPLRDFCTATTGDLDSVIRLFASICGIVQHLHDRGIIHRDLKPTNILVDSSGRATLLDLGISQAVGHGRSGSAVLSGLGSENYASREQRLGDPATVQDDVFALGQILRDMISWSSPSRGPARRSPLRGKSRDDLRRIVSRAVMASPDDRFAQVADLRREIENLLGGRLVLRDELSLADRARHYWRQTVLSVAALAVLAAVGIILWQRNAIDREADKRRATLSVAVESLESLTQFVDNEKLLRQPQLTGLRLLFLKNALTLFQRSPIRQDMESRDLVQRVATQLLHVAESMEETVTELQLLQESVDLDTPVAAVAQAQELLARFLRHHPDDAELQLMLASAGRRRADFLLSRGEETQSTAQCVSSQMLCDQLLSRPGSMFRPQSVAVVVERSRIIRVSVKSLYGRAMNAPENGERRRHLTEALELLIPLKRSLEPWQLEDFSAGLELARVLNAIGLCLHKGGQLTDEAVRVGSLAPVLLAESGSPRTAAIVEIFKHAIKVCDGIRAHLPESGSLPADRTELDRLEAQILNNMTLSVRAIARETGDWKTPLALHERGRALRQGVLDRQPWLLGVRVELAQSLGNIADTLSDCPDPAREMEARRSAIDVLGAAMAEFPSAAGIRKFWALHMIRLMTAQHRVNEDDSATRTFQETIRQFATPEDAEPTNGGHILDVAIGHLLASACNDGVDTHRQSAIRLILRCRELNPQKQDDLRRRLMADPIFDSLQNEDSLQSLLNPR
jgi:serine/threonine protein kinase